MAVTPLVPHRSQRPRSEALRMGRNGAILNVIRSTFSISTVLLLGALFQGTLLILLPYWWTLAPTVLALLYRTSRNTLITLKLIPNPYLQDAILDHVAASLPTDADPSSTAPSASSPTNSRIAVLHLGAKYNHPLGPFSPHAPTLQKLAGAMYMNLDARKQHNGYLGGNSYVTYDARGAMEYVFVAYFRSIEDIHAFAYSDAHRKGWEWWNSVASEERRHIGINHEVFEAEAGKWEGVYINCQPLGVMGTWRFVGGDKLIGGTVEDRWEMNAVKARGRLRTSAGRLGMGKESLSERYSYVPMAESGVVNDREVRRVDRAEKGEKQGY
jgi:hypothetical protein